MLKATYDWTMRLAAHPRAGWALFGVAFVESSFFPIPPDVMLLPMVLAKRAKAWVYASLCTAGSVFGALAGVLALSDEQREAVDVSSKIDEIGLDSCMTLEFFLGVGRDLELEIGSNWFEDVPTLAEIADVLIEQVEESVAEVSS